MDFDNATKDYLMSTNIGQSVFAVCQCCHKKEAERAEQTNEPSKSWVLHSHDLPKDLPALPEDTHCGIVMEAVHLKDPRTKSVICQSAFPCLLTQLYRTV